MHRDEIYILEFMKLCGRQIRGMREWKPGTWLGDHGNVCAAFYILGTHILVTIYHGLPDTALITSLLLIVLHPISVSKCLSLEDKYGLHTHTP